MYTYVYSACVLERHMAIWPNSNAIPNATAGDCSVVAGGLFIALYVYCRGFGPCHHFGSSVVGRGDEWGCSGSTARLL